MYQTLKPIIMGRNYHELECYKRSVELARQILDFVKEIPMTRIADQLSSSALSISSNIAEGSQQSSPQNYLRYLHYSLGSVSELESQLEVLLKLEEDDRLKQFKNECKLISVMIRNLMKSVKSWIRK